eukprot:scaffold1073_cov98-Cylindrotheca_fusiformis.AAC.6
MKRILPSQRHDCDDNNEDGRSSSSYGHQTRSDGHRRVRAFLFVVVVMLMGGLWIDAQEQVTMDRPLDGTTASREKKKQKNEQQQQQQPTTTTTTSGRMNITETLQSIMNSTTTIATSSDELLDTLFQVLPDPNEQTTLEIYNMTTHQELLESIGSSSSSSTNDTFTICVNGGSSSAGAGGVRLEDRYFTKYYQYLTTRSILVRSSSQVVDRSHGNRNSLHSAMFAENFLPKNVDLLLWEFAINDGEQQQQLQKQQQQQQSALLAWLQQVERMKPEPPKVILVYLWPAFRLDESKTIINPVFVAHEQIAREFDFVLGHVNLISYIHEMKFPSWEDTQILYSADWMHINELGHSIVAFLLLHLVHGKTNHEKNKEDTPTTTNTTRKSDFTWHCGNETKEKRLIQSRIIGGGGGGGGDKFRSPSMSWTLEVPQNSQQQQSASFHTSANGVLMSSPFNITYLGKQDPLRQDRQGSIPLPCCSTKKKDNNSVATTTIGIVTANTTNTTMDNVLLPPQSTGTAQAIFFGFGQIRPFDSIQIDILHQHSTAESPETNRIPAGTLVVVDNDNHWASCMWNFPAFYHSYWYVLESEIAPPSAIRLCVESQEQCAQGSNNSGMMLVSMAVF